MDDLEALLLHSVSADHRMHGRSGPRMWEPECLLPTAAEFTLSGSITGNATYDL